MKQSLYVVLLILLMAVPVRASELSAPEVCASGKDLMPQNADSFGHGLLELLENSIKLLNPEFREASSLCGAVIITAFVFSVLPIISPRIEKMAAAAGCVSIAVAMLHQTNSMLVTATETVRDILDYGKLLCQVMTAALAAQGGVTSSSALYVGTALFLTILNVVIFRVIIPFIFVYLAFSIAYGVLGDEILKKTADMIKGACYWIMKTLLMIFTTYMTITGTVSGATDLAAMKATKVFFSSAIPIVGGILSDSSEAVLVSMRIIKNTAGIYGILAVLAVFMGPFIKIGMYHILLKATSVLCGVFGDKRISALAEAFSTAMSVMLAMIGAGCILVLISTVCFLKGAA